MGGGGPADGMNPARGDMAPGPISGSQPASPGTRFCAMYTGGKDSCYSLHWAVLHGLEPACLVTFRAPGWESMLFHYPNVELVRLHSEAMGIPVYYHTVEGDEYRATVEAFREARRRCGCSVIVAGATASDYQRLRFAMAALEAGLEVLTPIWGVDQAEYMRWLVEDGFVFILTSVQAYGLPPEYLGRPVTREMVEDIVRRAELYGFNPAFEGGEAETLVLDAPLFRKRLVVEGRVVRLGPDHYQYVIERAWLEEKDEG